MADPMLFAIPAAMPFAERVCAHLGLKELEPMDVSKFACGETRVDNIQNSVRDRNVYVVGWGVGAVNDNLIEVITVVSALRLASAKKITVVYPNLPYSRQDRKAASRQPITSKTVANMLTVAAGCDHVITMDLHASQIQGFYDPVPVDNLYGSPTLVSRIAQSIAKTDPVAVVSPDMGGSKRADATVTMLKRLGFENVALVVMYKARDPKTGEVVKQEIIGDPSGRHCILVDDMGDTCGTLLRASTRLREIEGGVLSVNVAITHGVFSKGAVARLREADQIDKVYVTDTCLYPEDFAGQTKIEVLSVTELFAQAIHQNHIGGSVSHLFD